MKIADWKRRNLFIKNLDEGIDEYRLEKIFEDYGEIESVRIVYSSAVYFEPSSNVPQTKKESKGAGFVCYKTPESARTALQKLNGTPVNNKRIVVTWWLPKEERMKNKRSFPRQPMMPPAMMMPHFYGMQPMGMMQMPMQMGGMPMQQPYMGQQGNPQQQRGGGRGGRYQGSRGPRPAGPPGGPPQQPQIPQGFENLKTMDKGQRDQLVGDRIYPKIKGRHGDHHAGKLTGMILGLDADELLELVKDDNKLFARADEALRVLQEHSTA